VRVALGSARPAVVLIEGPSEADGLVALAAEARLRLPVALLAYPGGPKPADDQKRAALWPLAEFSPQWQAIRWAVESGVPVRLCELLAAIRFAAPEVDTGGVEPRHHDPIGELANVAGYDDPERWWEDVVEHHLADIDDPLAPFDAIAAAMAAVRAAAPPSAVERPARRPTHPTAAGRRPDRGRPGEPAAEPRANTRGIRGTGRGLDRGLPERRRPAAGTRPAVADGGRRLADRHCR